MKERFQKIMKGLLILVCSIGGLWEYMQLTLSCDMPQVVFVVPAFGLLAAIFLRKLSFIVLGTTSALAIVFELVQEKFHVNTILNNLPVILIFMILGIGGGFLVRVLINRKKTLVVGIVCCVLGIALTFGFGIVAFGNPLYSLQARNAINKYADKYRSEEYPVSEVEIYYSYDAMEYHGQVVMSDGYRYALYHDKKKGTVYEIEQ